MIIDSTQYNGICSCGKEHKLQTEFCILANGCLRDVNAYLSKCGLHGYTVAVYDENTYRATADRHPRVDHEIVLDPTDLHANEHGVDYLMKELPRNASVLIAIGAGTIHDLTRYCAYTLGIPFVSCPTAASVDGFCSSVAAMTWHGCKKTLTAVAPKMVIADIDIIKHSPMRLTRSGFGDMIGKYIALTDWRIGNILTGEFYCERIAQMTLRAAEAVMESTQGIMEGRDEAYEKLIYGLLLSGLAMQMMRNSRPASGAEHHISHIIEMEPPYLHASSDALHGEKVGVGTLLAILEYKRLAQIQSPTLTDYAPYTAERIQSIFGESMWPEIAEENRRDCAEGITGEALANAWEKICRVIEALPSHGHLLDVYSSFGVKKTLSEIDMPEELTPALLEYAHLVRNRLTLMRLRKCIIPKELCDEIQ